MYEMYNSEDKDSLVCLDLWFWNTQDCSNPNIHPLLNMSAIKWAGKLQQRVYPITVIVNQFYKTGKANKQTVWDVWLCIIRLTLKISSW